ncbi:MAG: amidophosphoribosyltransferase [Bacteroidia bacterium]|nr:amidophosphoribosyltransferase [Bacteroidia bacterium]
MSDHIKHECGFALLRLLKPLSYYHEKYGTSFYGINKLRLLLQKQRNRGQDGAGMATIKIGVDPGVKYIDRQRNNEENYIDGLFRQVYAKFSKLSKKQLDDPEWLKANVPFMGELLLGHLRYGTHGSNDISTVHPFLRQNNWISRNLVLAGNFNLTNVDTLFDELVQLGQYPIVKADTVTVLEKIGHFLDDEVQRTYNWLKNEENNNQEINDKIFENLNVQSVLRRACRKFDGGFVMAGMIGHGDAFVLRDQSGIRPAVYYHDDEVVVVASERPAIQTAFNVHYSKIKEIKPSHAVIIRRNGSVTEVPYSESKERRSCSFERIYFARGSDKEIYHERKKLGEQLVDRILKEVRYDLKNTVFAYVPNTAESAFLGFENGLNRKLNKRKEEQILALNGNLKPKKVEKILSVRPRIENIVSKDMKLRTFIAADKQRDDMISHAYDVTYGVVQNEKDTLVLIDDSIVRGNTLKHSIIGNVARLRPKKIIIVSSAPQIRYPDCYGIDMSKMHKFVAFQALIKLLYENNKEGLIEDTYYKCLQVLNTDIKPYNPVKELYANFNYGEIANKIAEIVTPKNIKPKVKVVYQTLEGLHKACPQHTGDWFFSGDYPTAGGFRVVCKSFVNFFEKKDVRAY